MEIIPNWHPVFVHFTVAMLTMSSILYCVLFVTDRMRVKSDLLIVANWLLWIGTAFTIGTIATGLYAYYTVAHDDASHLAMTDHRNWAILTALFFTGMAIKLFFEYRHNKHVSVSKILFVTMLVGLFLLTTTAWKGGEVVYRYGVGVMSLPDTSKSGHDHGDHNLDSNGDVHSKDAKQPSDLMTSEKMIDDSHGDKSHVHSHKNEDHEH